MSVQITGDGPLMVPGAGEGGDQFQQQTKKQIRNPSPVPPHNVESPIAPPAPEMAKNSSLAQRKRRKDRKSVSFKLERGQNSAVSLASVHPCNPSLNQNHIISPRSPQAPRALSPLAAA